MSLFNKLLSKLRSSKDRSEEMISPEDLMFQEFLNCESVFRHQPFSFPRFTKESPATLGFLIKALFPTCEGKVKDAINLSMREFGNDSRTVVISNPKEVENLCPIDLILYTDEKGEEFPRTGLNNTFVVKFNEDAPFQEVLFHFRGIGGFYYNTPYVRVSVMIPPLSQKEDYHSGKPGGNETLSGYSCAPRQTSFVIVEDRQDNRTILNQYESIEKDVEKKLRTNAELTFWEQGVYRGFREFGSLKDYFRFGHWFMNQERWYDAYRQFIRVYHVAQQNVNNDPDRDQSWYYSLAFDLGKCLSKMGRLDEAAYFLTLASTQEEKALDCLDNVYARLGDIRVKESIPLQKHNREALRKETENPYKPYMLTIGYMLGELFGVAPGSLIGLVIRNDDEECDSRITGQQEVWNTPISTIAKDKTTAIVMYSPYGIVTGDEADKSKLCRDSTFVIRVHKAQPGKNDGLLRVNIMLPAFNMDPDKMFLKEEHIPEGLSIIIGKDEPQEIKKQSQSAILRHITDLAHSGRYLESCHEAKYTFNKLLSRWEELTDQDKTDFFETSYWVGYAFMDFRLTEKAYYYLEIASLCHIDAYCKEYLNCLCNAYDPRTISIINSFLDMRWGTDSPNAILEWKRFLMRRKSYFLIEQKKYKEAKDILNELLNDPDPTNQDFAKNELAFIEGQIQ